MSDEVKSASDRWYDVGKNRDDRPRVSVWMPTSFPFSRLQVIERGHDEPPVLPEGGLVAHINIGGIELGGFLDHLELLIAAAAEELARTRAYATELRGVSTDG